jgi:hypothetical protein
MATEKQLNFFKKLAAERLATNKTTGEIDDRTVAEVIAAQGPETEEKIYEMYAGLSTREMSAKIDALMQAPKMKTPATNGSTANVPDGHYAIVSLTGNNDLDFFRVKAGKGRWEGRTFVDRVIGGHPETPVRGAEAKKALAAIESATPAAAATLYGQQIGRCSRCNRHLTDEISREFGMGPDCREIVGL